MSRSFFSARLSRYEHPAVLTAYMLSAFVMSFPLVAQFGDHIAGVDGDVWSYLWAMGWARVSVFNLGVNPFHTDYIFYPLGGATQLLWGTALASFASIPLQFAFGLVPAFNLMYIAASVLTAYGMYLLGKEILTDGHRPSSVIRRSSFVIGLVFAFGALRLGYGIAFTNLFHTEFIPFYVLFLLRATRNAGWKPAILAGLFFALNVYIDFQIAAFLAVLTGLWFLCITARELIRRGQRYAQVRDALRVRETHLAIPIARWLVLGIVAAVLSLPMLALVLRDFSIEGGNYIRVYPLGYSAERSYDVLSFVIPNARSTLYQTFAPRVEGVNASVNTQGDTELSPDRQAFLGVTVFALALWGAVRFRRAMLFWILLTAVFAILALGPVLHFAGMNTNIPLPFALVNNIPILNHIRIPMRYGVLVFFGAAILAGAGASVLLQWKAWLVIPLGALILLEAALLPYPTLEFRVPTVYEQIARDQGDFAVLEIPSFHWRHAAKNETYQAIHQKRILRAYTNRIAPDLADYFGYRQTPIVVKSLRILEGAEQANFGETELAQDRAVANDTLNFFNLRYAILHRDQLDTERATYLDRYLRQVLDATVLYQDKATAAYQFPSRARPAQPLALDLAEDSSLMYLGRGWQMEPLAELEGARGRYLKSSSEIFFQPDGLSERSVRFTMLNAGAPTNLNFRFNGQPLGVIAVSSGASEISFDLPAHLFVNNLQRLQIQNTAPPTTIAIARIEIK